VNEVVSALRAATRWTAICHENPDADTLGAGLALARGAAQIGITAEVVCVDPPPPYLAFLPGIETVRREPAFEPGLAVIVDAGDLARIGSLASSHADWLGHSTVVNIDHHVSNPRFGQAAWVDAEAAATCEMVALLLPELGVAIDAEIAALLMAGIVNDTHTFAHPNATPRTLRVAADLLAAGAPLHEINRAVYADKPYSTIALWGRMLGGVQARAEERIVYAAMTADMLRETGTLPSAGEGFIDLLASTRSGEVAVLFKETGPTETRVSVRTAGQADAVAITSQFGGGGHAQAAGCTVAAPLAEARERVLAVCESELAAADAGRH
jgi:phosphoesterase RecJ-like protein